MIIYLGNCKNCKKQFELGKRKPVKDKPINCPECGERFIGISSKNVDDKYIVLVRKYNHLLNVLRKQTTKLTNKILKMKKTAIDNYLYGTYIRENYPEIHKETINICFNIRDEKK